MLSVHTDWVATVATCPDSVHSDFGAL